MLDLPTTDSTEKIKFLFQYARPEEFYVGLVNNKPAVAAILQADQKAQDWKGIDKGAPQLALYIHWLCVHRQFADMELPKIMIDFATRLAKERNIELLRVDTNAKEMKLRKIYENLGFRLVGVEQGDYRKTAFYQKKINGGYENLDTRLRSLDAKIKRV